jgi:hypothetical protein
MAPTVQELPSLWAPTGSRSDQTLLEKSMSGGDSSSRREEHSILQADSMAVRNGE